MSGSIISERELSALKSSFTPTRDLQTNLDIINNPDISPTDILSGKLESIKQAREEKIRTLSSLNQKEDKLAVSDETAYTPEGFLANTAAGVTKMGVDMGAWILGAPATAASYLPSLKTIEEKVVNPIKEITPQPIRNVIGAVDEFLAPINPFTKYIRDLPETIAGGGKAAQKLVEPIYNPIMQENLQAKFAEAYDSNTGFINTATDFVKIAATNPIEGAHLFTTNLPYMLALANKGVIGIASFLGMVSDTNNQSLEKFRKSYGREPNAEEQALMLGTSIASTGVEKLESLFLLGKLGKPAAVSRAVSVPTKFATGGVTEFGQESAQNLLTDIGGYQSKLLDDPSLQAEVKREAVIAGGMGATSGAVGGAGVQALNTSGEKLKAQNKSIEHIKTVTDAFKQTEAYSALPEAKEAPVAAFRAFEKVVKDTATTPEQKQAAFDTAVSSLVNTPQFNTQAIATGLAAQAKVAGITIPDPITQVLIDLGKQQAGIVEKAGDVVTNAIDKTTQTARQAVVDFRNNIDKNKAEITDELIEKDPVFAMEILSLKKIDTTDRASFEKDKAELVATFNRISGSKNVPVDLVERMKEHSAEFVRRVVEAGKLTKPIKDVVQTVVDAKPDTFGSSADEFIDRIEEASDSQIETVSKLPALSPEQKQVVEAFKELRARKSTGEVSKNIEEKSDSKMISIPDHMNAINAAIVLGDKDKAESTLNKLKEFASKYAIKAENVAKAFIRANETNQTQLVDQIDPKADKLNIISSNDGKGSAHLVANIGSNNALIQAKFLLAQAQFNNAFKPKQTTNIDPLKTELQALIDVNTGKDNLWDMAAKQAMESTDAGRIQGVINKAKSLFKGDVGVTQTKETITSEQRSKEAGQATATPDPVTPIEVSTGRTASSKDEANFKKELENKDKRQVQAKIELITQEQNKRRKLLDNENDLIAYAEYRGISVSEMRELLTENFNDNELRLAAYKKLIDSIPKADTSGITFSTELGAGEMATKPVEPVQPTQATTLSPASVKSAVGAFKSGVYAVANTVLSKARSMYLNALKPEDRPKAITRVAEAEAKLPKYTFGDSVFTNGTSVIKTLESNPLLADTAKQVQKIAEAIAQSIKGNNPKEQGTMFQSLADNPAIAFMQIKGKDLVANPVITEAIAIAAHNFIGTQSGGLLINTDFTIRAILGLDSKKRIPHKAQILRYAGTNINTLADDIGAEVMNLLQLSLKSDNESIDRKRMQHALGFMAIKGLLDLGYVQQNPILKEQYDSLFDKDSDVDTQAEIDRVVFISVPLNRDKNNKPILVDNRVVATESVQQIRDTYKDEKFKEAFKATTKVEVESKIKPITRTGRKIPTYLKNTFQVLSDTAKKAIGIVNDRPYTFNDTAFNLFKEMYQSDLQLPLLEALGYNSNLDALTAYERDGVEAANLLILREIEDLLEFHSNVSGDKKFYFNHDVWKNSRIGLSSDSGINPQASKIVRHLVTLDSFNVKLGPELQGTARKQAIEALKVSIAAGLDIDPGKKTKADVLAKLQEIIQDIESPLSIALQNPSKENIIGVMKEYGMKTHTLESFLALKELLDYETDKKLSVTVRTAVEIDGKTNGVAISLAQFFGVPEPDLPMILKKVGLFTNESDTQYITANKGLDDLYETITRGWASNVGQAVKSATGASKELWQMQQMYIGNLLSEELDESGKPKVDKAAREAGKYPFMKTIFGQSVDTLKGDFGNELVARIYKKLKQINELQDPTQIPAELEQLNNDIKVLSGRQGTFPTTGYMQHLLPDVITNAIAKNAEDTYGQALSDAIDEKFKPFYELRNTLNQTVAAMANLFIGLVEAKAEERKVPITNELLKELMEKSIKDGGLKEFVPALKTPHAKTLEEGFIAIKKFSKRSGDIDSKVQVNYFKGKPIQNHWLNGTKTSTYSHTGGITEISMTDASVGTMIGLIHSFDGAQMQTIISELEAFGVHDAWLINALEAETAGQRLNEVFKNQNEQYSIANSIAERLTQIQKLIETERIPQNLLDNFKEEIGKVSTNKNNFREVVRDIEVKRDRWFKKIKNWAQFVFENSGFSTIEEVSVLEPSLETVAEDTKEEETVIPTTVKNVLEEMLTKFKGITPNKKEAFKNSFYELYKFTLEGLSFEKDLKVKRSAFYETNKIVLGTAANFNDLVHEVFHAATVFGIKTAFENKDPTVFKFNEFLLEHKSQIIEALKDNTSAEANDIRYIYEIPVGDIARPYRMVEEAFSILGSKVNVKKLWVDTLADPKNKIKNGGKTTNLFKRILDKLKDTTKEFFNLMFAQDEKNKIKKTKALELYYAALAVAMETNVPVVSEIIETKEPDVTIIPDTPKGWKNTGDLDYFRIEKDSSEFIQTIIIFSNKYYYTVSDRKGNSTTESANTLEVALKEIESLFNAVNSGLVELEPPPFSPQEQQVLNSLSPKEVAATIESLICRGAK